MFGCAFGARSRAPGSHISACRSLRDAHSLRASGALPLRQSHVIDPFVKWSTGGILVQLVLDAGLILPRGRVDRPSLIESVSSTVEDERVVAILRGTGALNVPLNVVPARRPVRARDSIQNPSIALAIPRGPVAISKVALGTDHEFVATLDDVKI